MQKLFPEQLQSFSVCCIFHNFFFLASCFQSLPFFFHLSFTSIFAHHSISFESGKAWCQIQLWWLPKSFFVWLVLKKWQVKMQNKHEESLLSQFDAAKQLTLFFWRKVFRYFAFCCQAGKHFRSYYNFWKNKSWDFQASPSFFVCLRYPDCSCYCTHIDKGESACKGECRIQCATYGVTVEET